MATKQIRIAIAEDSAVVRLSLKNVLVRENDMEVVGEADSGDRVFRLVEEKVPDVVLMDIGLPGLDGVEATRKLKGSFSGIKVIMVTAHTDDRIMLNAFAAGADGYFLKGSNGEQLPQAVRSVFAGAAWLHPAIAARVLQSCVRGATKLATGELLKPSFNKSEKPADKTLSLSSSQTANLLFKMAFALDENSRADEIEALFTGALAILEKTLAPSDPSIPAAMTFLADFYFRQEKYIPAEKLYQKALELRHTAFGQDNIEVAKSLENLGMLYDSRSNYAEAEHFYYWSLMVRDKVLGKDNPLSRETLVKLAWVYRAQGKEQQAEEMENRAHGLK